MDAVTTTFSPSRRIGRSPLCLRASVPPCLASPGFTFIEVLFAIIILGVGLIMIAGMIPVAIQQGQKSQEDLNGRIVCDNGYAILRKSIESFSGRPAASANPFNGLTIRPSPSGVAFMEYGHADGAVFLETLHDRVNRPDPRFAWMPFVQAQPNSNRINLVMLGLVRRDSEVKSNYLPVTDGTDSQPFFAADVSGSVLLHNGPSTGRAIVIDGEDASNRSNAGIPSSEPSTVDHIILSDEPSLYVAGRGQSEAPLSEVAAEGAFVIIAGYTAERTGLTAADVNRNTGRVFRLGQNVSGNLWRLDPAHDLPLLAGNAFDTTLYATGNERPVVWVVGRGLRDPAKSYANDNKPIGPAQDVAVERYSFTIR